MKRLIPFCIAVFLCANVFSVHAAEVPSIRIGHVEICTLADVENDFDAALFKLSDGKAVDPALLEKYMSGGKTPGSMSAFLLKIDTGKDKPLPILIDTGLGTRMNANLEKSGVKPNEIETIFLTHMHGDHVGGLLEGGARRFPRATVFSVRTEYDYWCGIDPAGGGVAKPRNEQIATIMKLYGKDFTHGIAYEKPFSIKDAEGKERVAITPIDAPGHTPGHTAFLVESDGKKLLVCGDFLHAAALQFPVPDACARYDMDPKQAAASRKMLIEKAITENLPFVGAHLPFPCIGTVRRAENGNGIYQYLPLLKKAD